jgi:aminomuconate-semialdehyde/2-hydroxymuconate-6-semialdehyde dehydrogenase
VLSYYAKAAEEGATVVTGGGVPDMPARWPTAGCSPPSGPACPRPPACHEEIGPCCHIAPFDTEEEVPMVNTNRYGLATSIYTQDIGRANRMAQKIDVGLCWINSWFLRDLRTPSAAPSSRASAARAACIRWSSTPSCAT